MGLQAMLLCEPLPVPRERLKHKVEHMQLTYTYMSDEPNIDTYALDGIYYLRSNQEVKRAKMGQILKTASLLKA